MIVFFADRPLIICSRREVEKKEDKHYDSIIDLRLLTPGPGEMKGHVLLLNVTTGFVVSIVHMLQNAPPGELLSVTLAVSDRDAAEEIIKAEFKVIKAAGGIVCKKDKCLLIFRKKKWDLPKGKLDRGEKSREAAVREIEEETGVKGILRERLCTTWHTYTEGGELVLKRTKWYILDCVSDKSMKPQEAEEIERLEWVTLKAAQSLLINSYSSIRYVFKRFEKRKST